MPNGLITGGAGFIGSHLREAWLKQGHQAQVFDHFSPGKRGNLIIDEPCPALEIIEREAGLEKAVKYFQ